jgi:cysteine-rich CPXCG protein
MRRSEAGYSSDDESDGVDNDLPDEVVLDTDATVACPHCGETIVIGIDPGGGTAQDYVEDCQVCCRPCRVRVTYDDTGAAEVTVDEMP